MIKVLTSGLLSSFQDRGRYGFRKYGVPVSGAMDSYSAGLANLLLNNSTDVPVIEITMQGPTLLFSRPTAIALTGADISPVINGEAIGRNAVINIQAGDQLAFGKLVSGCRCYIAVKGGFGIGKVLDSYSFYPGISDTHRLHAGMEIPLNAYHPAQQILASVRVDEHNLRSRIIPVRKGPEFEVLSGVQRAALFETEFMISPKNNRMGYQLTGASMACKIQMLTDVVLPGTVQLTPDGYPIVLMRDCQTTGGYPRILQLTEQGINRLAQKKTNEAIRFQLEEITGQGIDSQQ